MTGEPGDDDQGVKPGEKGAKPEDGEVLDTREIIPDPDEDSEEEVTDEEAEEQFAAGFESVKKDAESTGDDKSTPDEKKNPDEEGTKAESQQDDDEPGSGEPAGEVISQEEARSLKKRLRKVEGVLGGLNERLEKAQASGSGTEADQKQIAQSLKDIEAMQESMKEFAELAPFISGFEEVSERISKIEQALTGQRETTSSTPEDLSQLVTEKVLDAYHPSWREDVASPEFNTFVLHGGPSKEEYQRYAALLRDPARKAEAKEYEDDWKEDFPAWWKEKGDLFINGDTAEAVKLLEGFREANDSQAEREAARQRKADRRKQRLRGSAVPRGAGAEPVTGVSDDEAFERGFKNVNRAKQVG